MKWFFISVTRYLEGDKGLSTVECLRGRLLAERAASKAANDESEQLTKRVTELEKQLKMEIKSRNKAEKRLKFLMKKLESLNMSYVSADEPSSSISEKSEISSVSSSKSQVSNISKCVKNNDMSGERHKCPSYEDNLGSLDDVTSEKSIENVIQSGPKEDSIRSKFTHNNNDNEEHDQDTCHNEQKLILTPRNDEGDDDVYDNSMALVVVDYTVKEEKKDVAITNGHVKDVLDALRYARECIQASMDMRRRVKSNIVQPRLDRISC
ncbi:uncharacterized protein LOC143615975 [Bidens hawaiensis]|uniref:uncharacterized protein LOC143615975 n=1 Tax=Bidens hawaiensis TaxID=980011 RepID=UPI00404B4CA5